MHGAAAFQNFKMIFSKFTSVSLHQLTPVSLAQWIYLSKSWFTRDNGKMRSVEPEPIVNGFSFLVNENVLVWEGCISLFCAFQVNTR